MKKNNTGYKGMLRDRIPKVVNYALKWQKAKERWINHAYSKFINIYVDKEERKKATRIVLCLREVNVKKGKKQMKPIICQNFDFDKSIDWDNLTEEETAYWKRVSSWVEWFRTEYAYAQNAYEISKKCGKDEMAIKVEIIRSYFNNLLPSENDTKDVKQAKYNYVDNLINFLFKCFEGNV